MRKVAFYGSLRKGCYNYNHFKTGLTERGQAELSGFQLFSLGAYPCIIRSDDPADKVVIDLFEANEETFQRIHRMELGAGYNAEVVEVNGEDYTIYTFPQNQREYLATRRVNSGDWLNHVQGTYAKYCEQ
jgi:gamma-glutamylcyclotransferase (GGCT)/AIG2-like uncharacterized protein YtfP